MGASDVLDSWPRGVKQPPGAGVIRVPFDEYIADINGSVGFTTTAFQHNPGQVGVFPLTSKEAVIYEKYCSGPCEYYYKPEVSQFATNGTTGKVMLSFDYDASDSPPSTKQAVESTDPHADGMPYETIRLTLDPDEMNGGRNLYKYVRPGGLPGGADIKMYDAGTAYVSTYGNAATSVVGELRVRGHVWFRKKILESVNTAPTNFRSALFSDVSLLPITASAVPQLIPLVITNVNGIGAVNTAGIVVLPVGNYIVDVACSFTFDGPGECIGTMSLQVDGSAVYATSVDMTTLSTLGAFELSTPWFVSSTGATTVSVQVQVTFPGAGAQEFGVLRIVSV
jgi:hypothetical protein